MNRFENDVYIEGISTVLGQSKDLKEAVKANEYSEEEYVANALTHVSVVEGLYPPELAVEAVNDVITNVSRTEFIRLHFHASTYFQGQDLWTPAAYIQNESLSISVPWIEVDQKSNGGLAAIHLARQLLSSKQQVGDVLITTAERYAPPGFNQYRSESGTVMADGATAMILSTEKSPLRLVDSKLTADSSLEPMYRGEGFRSASQGGENALDLRQRKMQFMLNHRRDLDSISARIAGGLVDVMESLLSANSLNFSDVSRIVLPNNGKSVYWWRLLEQKGVSLSRTTWDFGKSIGHLGAGDQAAALSDLLSRRSVSAGDYLLIAGSGYGFSWGAALLQVEPSYDGSAGATSRYSVAQVGGQQ